MKPFLFVLIAACLSVCSIAYANSNQMAASATAPMYQSKTTSSISIAPRGNLIIATVVTQWDTKASDTLAIDWIAPKGSYCRNSQFTLVRGPNINHDVSWAYRTVVHTNSQGNSVTCQGHWTARVINVNNGKILASAGYNVLPGNARAASTSASSGTTTVNEKGSDVSTVSVSAS